MQIGFNEPVQGYDLAQILQENEGTFIAKQNGQMYLVVSQRGHSIKFGPKPVGTPSVDVGALSGQASPWTVQRLSHSDLSRELAGESSGSQTDQGNIGIRRTA